MSSLSSLRRVTPQQAYQNAKERMDRVTENIENSLRFQGTPDDGHEYGHAEKLYHVFQVVARGTPEFEANQLDLERRLSAIRARIESFQNKSQALTSITPSGRVVIFTLPQEVIRTINQLEANRDEILRIIEKPEKKLKRDKLAQLINGLSSGTRENIYTLHEKRELEKRKTPLPRNFGRKSFENRDRDCKVPRTERIATLRAYHSELEKICSDLRSEFPKDVAASSSSEQNEQIPLNFLNLPVEIQGLVVRLLSLDAVARLGQTCKELYSRFPLNIAAQRLLRKAQVVGISDQPPRNPTKVHLVLPSVACCDCKDAYYPRPPLSFKGATHATCDLFRGIKPVRYKVF